MNDDVEALQRQVKRLKNRLEARGQEIQARNETITALRKDLAGTRKQRDELDARLAEFGTGLEAAIWRASAYIFRLHPRPGDVIVIKANPATWGDRHTATLVGRLEAKGLRDCMVLIVGNEDDVEWLDEGWTQFGFEHQARLRASTPARDPRSDPPAVPASAAATPCSRIELCPPLG